MIFQLVQKNLSILGITKTQPNNSCRMREIIGCLLVIAHIIIRLKFLLNDANSFQLYTRAAFMSSVAIANLCCLASLIHKRKEIYKLIDGCENVIVLFKECKFRFILFVWLAYFSICIICFKPHLPITQRPWQKFSSPLNWWNDVVKSYTWLWRK